MFSAYSIFHCLNMFFVEKQVSEFFTTHLATSQSCNASREFIQKLSWLISRLTRDSRKFSQLISRLASHEMLKNSFLKCFLWETCLKPLQFSLKPLFQYFYI